jgi:hypothetical protein
VLVQGAYVRIKSSLTPATWQRLHPPILPPVSVSGTPFLMPAPTCAPRADKLSCEDEYPVSHPIRQYDRVLAKYNDEECRCKPGKVAISEGIYVAIPGPAE